MLELRGFVSDDLVSALGEIHAISKGTKAKQYLFSLSLNPPPEENVFIENFEDAVNRVEDRLGLTGQPRGIILHEKNGRCHAHAVWSRIDADKDVRAKFTDQEALPSVDAAREQIAKEMQGRLSLLQQQ